MSIIHDFKKFISRGNVLDVAVGIIVGASFSKIVDVLVNKILMPPIGVLVGGVDFSGFKITIKHATETSSAVTIDYGLFINSIINFLIVSAAVFILLKLLRRIYPKKEESHPEIDCPECKMKIPFGARRCGHCTAVLLDSSNPYLSVYKAEKESNFL